jgi:hypothetical protein
MKKKPLISFSVSRDEAGAFIDILLQERMEKWREDMIDQLSRVRIDPDTDIAISVKIETSGLALLMFLRGVDYGKEISS